MSVVLPTFNRASLLRRSIWSVLQQTFRDLELIIVNDGSTDETDGVLRQLADERVRIIRLPANYGPSAARNAGLDGVRGKLVAFQDSDDEWLPGKLEAQVGLIESDSRIGAVGCGRITITRRGALTTLPGPGGSIYEDLLAGRVRGTGTPLLLVRRDAWPDARFDERFPALEERDFLLGIAKRAPLAFVHEPLVRVYRNLNDHVANARNAAAGYQAFLSKYSDELAARPSVLAWYHARLGRELALLGEREQARRHFSEALAITPQARNWRALRLAATIGPRVAALTTRLVPMDLPADRIGNGYSRS